MKSLYYLNTHGQATVSATDTRPAGVVFDRVAPLRPIDQIFTATTTSVSVDPGIEILDIIQGATANVRYKVKIIAGGSPLLSSTISFPTLPSGVTQTFADSTYTLSGIDTVAKWNTVKSFTWNLASNWASCPLWYLQISIVYYDGSTGTDKTVSWLAYDEAHYWVSEMTSTSSMSASVLKVKKMAAEITDSSVTMVCNGVRVKNVQASLSSSASVTADGGIMVSSLWATTSISCHPYYKYTASASMSSTSSMTITPTYNYTDDLRIQVRYDSTRTTFAATVVTYQTNLVVYWGDGTSTSYTGTGDYRTHNVTKTFTGTGYTDIKFASSAVHRVAPLRGSDKCYIYKIYHWSRVPSVSATNYFSDSEYYNQIYLTDVPNYLPTNVTAMSLTFAGCTSLNDSNISSWNTSSMTNMTGIFNGCTSFNQSVSGWTVSNCTTLTELFRGCTSFNQPITWTVKNGANLSGMLQDCTGYNQEVNLTFTYPTPVTSTSITLNYFLNGATSFSTVNYNKLLINFANQVSSHSEYPRSVTLGVPASATETNITYGSGSFTTGQGAYTYLTGSPRSWTITKA